MTPVILVSAQFDKPGLARPFPHISSRYCDCIERAGGAPVIQSPADPELTARACCGLMLTGGGDADPSFYGENRIDAPFLPEPERDESEMRLYRAFRRAGKPVFGICRGIQLIAISEQGTLWQDLPVQRGINHNLGGVTHEVENIPGSIFYKLFGKNIKVNSYHHQAVKTAGMLNVASRSDDGMIEALEHPEKPVLGVQWHPELDYDIMKPLFEYFIALCTGDKRWLSIKQSISKPGCQR